tara:strand:+ start:376 stop:579 length:204 start_codon:yes stop_codon:yes gene_type:complete
MIRSQEEQERMKEINERMVNKTVRVTEEKANSWTGRVVAVVDHENFSVRRSKDSEPQVVNMFDIRTF